MKKNFYLKFIITLFLINIGHAEPIIINLNNCTIGENEIPFSAFITRSHFPSGNAYEN